MQPKYLDYWRRTFYPFFASAVRVLAAHCKLPYTLHPGLSQEDKIRTKEVTKERSPNESERPREEAKESAVRPSILLCRCHEGGRV